MKSRLWTLLLLLPGCELFVTDNPTNCVRVSNLCSAAEFCDTVTQRCQTLDCRVNTTPVSYTHLLGAAQLRLRSNTHHTSLDQRGIPAPITLSGSLQSRNLVLKSSRLMGMY